MANEHDSADRYIVVHGEKVPVTEAVYQAFKRPVWNERKRRKVRSEMEHSLEEYIDAGFDIPDEQTLVEESPRASSATRRWA